MSTYIVRHNLNIYNLHDEKPPADVAYVGRPSPFGNPWGFKDSAALHHVKTRREAVDKFREYCSRNATVVKLAKKHLKGKDLSCWCAPQPCHAEVLMDVANEVEVPCQKNSSVKSSSRRSPK